MGLTVDSVGIHSMDSGFEVRKITPDDAVIALAGNPNVGKSTVFNALTGLRQHTGNWPGKTVSNAQGVFCHHGKNYVLVDLPGTYSLSAHSKEEEVARDFICQGGADAVVVVCDATCLERNLNLVLQTLEITPNVIVCVNLMDEAEKKDMEIDLKTLSCRLGVPVIGTSARSKKGLGRLADQIEETVSCDCRRNVYSVSYTKPIEAAVSGLLSRLSAYEETVPARWLALRLLENRADAWLLEHTEMRPYVEQAQAMLKEEGIFGEQLEDEITSCLVLAAEKIADGVVHCRNQGYHQRDRQIDWFLTNRLTGIPVMLALLGLIFWITIQGANYPTALLSVLFEKIQDWLLSLLSGAPEIVSDLLVFGACRVLFWVVAVMLPPMAIFFPIFTLLEDLGYLPRIAFNLDHMFQKCHACGKQALTMCMGFGCNAAGVVGCRIIDSPRERLIAMLTNCLVPCNGRFPMMIAVITMFFAGENGFFGALILTCVVLFGIFMTFCMSDFLSRTMLRGEPSSFTLELPPYRCPRIGRVLVRSVFDRTLFVLGRAAAVAAPAGIIIWCFANLTVGQQTLLSWCSGMLDPLGRLIGLDGCILFAFLLGLPANEIVIPIILMTYLGTGNMVEMNQLTEMKLVLEANGWTWVTAVNLLLFSLMHWPCATTLLTIKKESGSWKWTVLSFLLPAAAGILCCFIFTSLVRIFL